MSAHVNKQMSQSVPVVDYLFPLSGRGRIPADHAYMLYAALCRILPDMHETPRSETSTLWRAVGVLPISGNPVGTRSLEVTSRSLLTIRAPAALYRDLLRVSGGRLDIAGCRITAGVPRLRPLRPATVLASRLVIIKGFLDATGFLDAVGRQLISLGTRGHASLVTRRRARPMDGGVGGRMDCVRRTVRIRDREIVGYAVRISDLDPAGSLVIQTYGVGGRRKFGCGIFLPASPETRP